MKNIDETLESIVDITVEYIARLQKEAGIKKIDFVTDFDEHSMKLYYDIGISIPITELKID